MKSYFKKTLLILTSFLIFFGLSSQENSFDYHNVIIHIQNDTQITKLVKSAFKHQIKKQKSPILYSIADSLTFIDINYVLEGKFDPTLGIDSLAFNSTYGYSNLYYFDNIQMLRDFPKPMKSKFPLHAFVSKRIGNTISVEIKEDNLYPTSQVIQFGTSVVVVLLVDEIGNITKNLFIGVVHNN